MKHHYDRPASLGDERTTVMTGRSQRSAWSRSERGAAVVEFAIILPVLLLIVFGIIEFGRGYNVQVELTSGVREGARALALGKSSAQAVQAVKDAATGVDLAGATFSNTACPADGADGNATVKVTYNLPSLTPLVPSGSINLTATGVMRCGL